MIHELEERPELNICERAISNPLLPHACPGWIPGVDKNESPLGGSLSEFVQRRPRTGEIFSFVVKSRFS